MIQGGGFFVVADDDGSYAYTRAGNFSFDRHGKLVTPDGILFRAIPLSIPLRCSDHVWGNPTRRRATGFALVASRPDAAHDLEIAADIGEHDAKVLERFECARPARLAPPRSTRPSRSLRFVSAA